LFANDKPTLWQWKAAVRERLAALRLEFHQGSAQVQPVQAGIPWLGFVVFPTHRRVKARKVVEASRRLGDRYAAWQAGEISFAEFDASVQGWINHVRYADSWGLRTHVLDSFVLQRNRDRRCAAVISEQRIKKWGQTTQGGNRSS
jgi:hypothetical protein